MAIMLSLKPHALPGALLTVLCAALLSVPSASAQSASEEQIDKAQDAVLKGRKLLRSGKYLEGIVAYERAYQLFPQPEHLFVIARAYGKIPGRCADALLGWDRFLRACTNCDLRSQGLESQTEMKTRCAAQDNRLEDGAPSSVQERFDAGRALYDQGRFADASSEFQGALDMFPSSAKITLSLARSKEREKDYRSAASLYSDYLRKAPDTADRAAIERLIASLERRGGAGQGSRSAATGPFSTSAAPSDAGKSNLLAWSSVGVGAVAAGLGAIFHVSALSTADDASKATNIEDYNRLSDDFDSTTGSMTASYIVGALLLTTGITLLKLDADSSATVGLGPGQLQTTWAF